MVVWCSGASVCLLAYLEGRREGLELPPLQVHVPNPALVLELGYRGWGIGIVSQGLFI